MPFRSRCHWCTGNCASLAMAALGRERPEHTLQTTALVHEAYLRPIDQQEASWKNRAHFFAVAAQMMRRILVDYARARQYANAAVALNRWNWMRPWSCPATGPRKWWCWMRC